MSHEICAIILPTQWSEECMHEEKKEEKRTKERKDEKCWYNYNFPSSHELDSMDEWK